jgi:hypothetical protein
MPNHVTNIVSFIGKEAEVRSLLESIGNKSEGAVIDFNKIIPAPKVLHKVTSPPKIVSEDEYKKEMEIFNDKTRTLTDIEKFCGVNHGITKAMQKDFIKKYGADNWYDWNCKHWGTKWNAYSHSDDGVLETNSGYVEGLISFQTAWSTPFPVIEKLSEMYPNIKIELKFADEDWGSNLGICRFENGTCIEEILPDSESIEAYENLW